MFWLCDYHLFWFHSALHPISDSFMKSFQLRTLIFSFRSKIVSSPPFQQTFLKKFYAMQFADDKQHIKKVKITDYFCQVDRSRAFNTMNNSLQDFENQKSPSVNMDLSEDDKMPSDIEVNHEFTKLTSVLTENNLRPLSSDSDTFVLYQQPWVQNQIPKPLSTDDVYYNPTNYLKLPFQEDVIVQYEGVPINKWRLIQKLLSQKFGNLFQLEKAIKSYNPYIKHFEFDIFRSYINFQLNDDKRKYFFDNLLPSIIRLALDLPNAITCNLPILDQGTSTALFLSQYQISCLLANAFLCTFTSRFKEDRRCINFVKLYSTNHSERRKVCKLEKLKCILNYFHRVTKTKPTGTISFERKNLFRKPKLEESTDRICKFKINSHLCLFENATDYVQVDFANKFIGGGVLNSGCVQEEILFVICPELIAGKLFTERMWEKDALLITGAEQYNQYTGYGDDFIWKSSFDDSLERDKYGRKNRQIIAMNATAFRIPKVQYEKDKIDQEIIKALSAFQGERYLVDQSCLPAIATGNWGCGVYRGDPYLKTLIQIIAASIMKRDLIYFAFDNDQLKKDFEEINLLLRRRSQLTVAQLYRATLEFAAHKANEHDYNLINFLKQNLL